MTAVRFLGDDLTLARFAALAAAAVLVGVPLGVQAGELVVQQQAPPAPTPESGNPTIPVNQAPADGAVGVSRTPTFEWTPAQDESRVVYTLQYTPDPTFGGALYQVVVSGMTEPEYTVEDEHRLPPGSTIHWRVFAIDRWSNPSEWSSPSSFTTGP